MRRAVREHGDRRVWRDYMSSLRRAAALDAGDLRTRCNLARVLARAGETAEARAMYEDVAAAQGAGCEVD